MNGCLPISTENIQKITSDPLQNNNLSNFKTDYPSLGDFFFSPFICYFVVVVLKRVFFVFFVYKVLCMHFSHLMMATQVALFY